MDDRKLYLNTVRGLLEAGYLVYVLERYIPNSGGILNLEDIYDSVKYFQVYVNSYYNRDRMKSYLKYVLKDSDSNITNKLLYIDNIDVIREVSNDYIKRRPGSELQLSILPVVKLMEEMPNNIEFDVLRFLQAYLFKMDSSLALNLIPNPLVLFKLFELYPLLKQQLIDEVLNPYVADPYQDVYYPSAALPKPPLIKLLKAFNLI